MSAIDDAAFSTGSELPAGTKIHSYEVVPVALDASGKARTCVGRGGFGTVYKVQRSGEVFAAKIGHLALSDYKPQERAHAEARIKREISILASLSHPNILRIHSFDFWPDKDGRPILITDWLEGEQLDQWRAHASPSLRTLCGAFATMSRALHSAHRQGIYHRDLKCENVIVRNDGVLVLVDWGIARSRANYTLTRVGSYLGTCTHFSPEYCRYALSDDVAERFVPTPQAELHAVGFMLFQLLTGAEPFPPADDHVGVMKAILRHQPVAPSSLNPHVPPELDALALRLLAKDPAGRPATGLELAEQLDATVTALGAAADRSFTVPAAGTVAQGAHQLTPPSPRNQPPEAVHLTADDRPGAGAGARVDLGSVEVLDEQPLEAPAAPRPSSAILAAAEKLRTAKGGRRALGAPAVVIGVSAAALLGIVTLVKLGPGTKAPENLLARVKAAEQGSQAEPPSAPAAEAKPSLMPPAPAPQPIAGTLELPPVPPVKAPGKKDPSAPSAADARAIDREIATHYGRPNVPAANAATQPKVATPEAKPSPSDDLPPWLRTAADSANADTEPGIGPKTYGVPTGAVIRARLQTNLDSRTVADGPVTVKLMRPFLVDGKLKFPSTTLLFGQASVSGQRFVIRFTRLRLPDRSEVAFEGLAYDSVERKPGLAASRTIQPAPASQPSVASKVAKGAANTLLSAAQAASGSDLATTVATEAGRTAVNEGEPAAGGSAGPALLLDQGNDLDIFVVKAF